MDLDQSGNTFQGVRVFLGPSLGWVQVRVRPERYITAAGTYAVTPDDGVILVNVAGAVTFNLPDVRLWVSEFAYNPATAFERAIWIKDLGGNAAQFNIQINPFGLQGIDTANSPYIISVAYSIARLYPLSDLSGWFVDTVQQSATTINVGSGTFASLPSPTGNEGMVATVNDSIITQWGMPIVGGGTHVVLAYCDGFDWIVAGT